MTTASIVLYKNSLEECYSVLEPLVNSVVETIFLIDHSGDNKLEVLTKYSPKIKYIPHKNLGYGSGHNVAFREAYRINPDGFHIVMNPDIILSAETISKMERFMSEAPTVGWCMPRILNSDGTDQKLCKYLPSPMDLFSKRFFPLVFARKRIDQLTMCDCDYDKVLSVPWLSGCFMFLRLKAVMAVEGFDERYFLYAEDIDLSRRVHLVYDTVYYPEVSVVHLHRADSYHSIRMMLIHIASVVKYFNKWGWFSDKERDVINDKARARNQAGIILPRS